MFWPFLLWPGFSKRLLSPKITNILVRNMNKGNMQSLSPMAHNLFQLLKQNMCLHLIMYVGITITYPEEIWCLLSTVTFSDSIAESSLLSSSIWVADCFVASSASAKESSWRNSSSTSWNKVEFEIAVAAAWLRNVFSQDYFFQNFTININTMYVQLKVYMIAYTTYSIA